MRKCQFFLCAGCIVIFISFPRQVSGQFTKLIDFNGSVNGARPQGALISDGTFLYGMNFEGGVNDEGTIFKVKADGTGYAKLFDFNYVSSGSHPYASLLLMGSTLYGTTSTGGSVDMGVIFKIETDGTGYVKMHEFTGLNGNSPLSSLVQVGSYLYGTTNLGGTNNGGTIFRIMPDGSNFSTVHHFGGTVAGVSDGASPYSGLTYDGTYIYGTTASGGTAGDGIVYKTNPDGSNYSILHHFTADEGPRSELTYDGTYLYGTTPNGGTSGNGTVYQISSDGASFTTLHDFDLTDGSYPLGSLTMNGSRLYGMAQDGGDNGFGVIYTLQTSGEFDVLHHFDEVPHGSKPVSSLTVIGVNIFGMTNRGGTSPSPGLGTLFKFTLSCVSASERSALIALYNSTNGASWLDKTNWLSANEGDWVGVAVSGCQVTAIVLPANNLTGVLPVELGDLPNLQELTLSFNHLSGSLPPSITNLTNLQVLEVDNNVTLGGDLPVNIGNMISLRELVTQANSFTGNIPASLSSCTSLEKLNLEGNQHTGSIPPFLGTFPNIQSINLGFNQFSGVIPTSISNLTQLTFLSLASNQLSGSIPAQLASNTQLQLIDLSRNYLTGQIPATLASLGSLKVLQLWSNQLSGELPAFLGFITSLEILGLGQNRLTGEVPDNFSNLTSLRILGLEQNQLTGGISPLFNNLSSLEEIDLSRNRLEGTVPEIGFSDVLKKLILNHNQFNSLDLVYGTYSELTHVVLHHNLFDAMIPFSSAGNLVQLAVENNFLDFEDLEENAGRTGYTYMPQAKLPPGGLLAITTGDPIDLEVFTSGTYISFRWFKNGVKLPGKTSSTLSIASATPADAGTYYVKVASIVFPGDTLQSIDFTLTVASCPAGARTAGTLDFAYDPVVQDPVTFNAVEIQSTGKSIVSIPATTIDGAVLSGIVRFETDGTIDPAFSVQDFHPSREQLIVQPDDKIITSGNSGIDTFLSRLNADGSPDAGFTGPYFDNSGYYETFFGPIALQPDGKVVYTVSTTFDFIDATYRVNSDGSPDATFSAPVDLKARVIKVQEDGKILVGGNMYKGIIRLNPDGSIDSGFAIGNGAGSNPVLDIAIQPDGKIILIGLFKVFNNELRYGIVRLHNDGSVDLSFNPSGILDLGVTGIIPFKVAIMNTGHILVAGNFSFVNGESRVNIVRLHPDGSIDCAFDPGISSNAPIEDMALQTDGKILITGGFSDYDGTGRLAFARINNPVALINITQQPADVSVCAGSSATFSVGASGTTNISYQWQFSSNTFPLLFNDIADGTIYSGTNTSTLSVSTITNLGEGRYRCQVSGDFASPVLTNDEGLFIISLPAPPSATATPSCGAGAVTLNASGGSAGQYRWYTVPIGGTALSGESGATYTTPIISLTTTYYVSVQNGVCESTRTAVAATVNDIPISPATTNGFGCAPSAITLTASGATNGQYRWYTVATGGAPISGQTSASYTTPAISVTTTYYVSVNDGLCESLRTPVIATVQSCIPPALASQPLNATVGGVTNGLNLLPLITLSTNAQLVSITIQDQPSSGAKASINNNILTVDYAGVSFTGKDQLTLKVCDTNGNCTTQIFEIDVAGDIVPYNAVSPNGANPTFIIEFIGLIPEAINNTVTIFDRWQNQVWKGNNYDNNSVVFSGRSDSGHDLPTGIYFYRIDFESGKKSRTGFISLKR